MTNEEIVRLVNHGNKALMANLYEQNKHFIYAIVQHTQINPDDYEDAMQDAYFGLYEAVNGFDESKGYKFLTYAKFYILNAIQRGQCNTLNIPERVKDTARKIRRIQSRLSQEFNRIPTTAELSKYTGLSTETIKYTLNAVKPVKSIYEPVKGYDDLEVWESLKDDTITFENDIAAADERKFIRSVVEELPERERQVVQLYYLQGLTYKEIGEKLGVSLDWVRQLLNKGLRHLRHPRISRKLLDEDIDRRTSFYQHRGVNRFNTTWTSSTEQIVIDRDYMRRKG
jgi:RNA polymerase primary sigma factor